MEPDELKGDILAIIIAALAIVVVSASFLPALGRDHAFAWPMISDQEKLDALEREISPSAPGLSPLIDKGWISAKADYETRVMIAIRTMRCQGQVRPVDLKPRTALDLWRNECPIIWLRLATVPKLRCALQIRLRPNWAVRNSVQCRVMGPDDYIERRTGGSLHDVTDEGDAPRPGCE